MRVYVAGRFTGRHRIKMEAETSILGANIVSTWLNATEADYPYPTEQAAGYAIRDMEELASADVLIVDTLDDSNTGGREVEFGAAWASGKKCIVVGPRRNVFHYLPTVEHYDTWVEFRLAVAGDFANVRKTIAAQDRSWTLDVLAAHIERLHTDHEAGEHKGYEQGCSLCEERDAKALRYARAYGAS